MTAKPGYVYILTNTRHSVLYTGVTNDLARRIHEHRHKLVAGFTKTYNADRLVHVEAFPTINEARVREKTIKGWVRHKKVVLIETTNPQWRDLYDQMTG